MVQNKRDCQEITFQTLTPIATLYKSTDPIKLVVFVGFLFAFCMLKLKKKKNQFLEIFQNYKLPVSCHTERENISRKQFKSDTVFRYAKTIFMYLTCLD